jgi:transposase
MGEREHYPSDVSDDQWKLLEPLLTGSANSRMGRGAKIEKPRLWCGAFFVSVLSEQVTYMHMSKRTRTGDREVCKHAVHAVALSK